MFKNSIKIFLVSLALNWPWEIWHSRWYTDVNGGEVTQLILFRSAVADAILITLFGLLFLYSLYFRQRIWWSIIFGVVVAVLIEVTALHYGLWGYKASMALVPWLGVGITPTIQLGLLSFITYSLVIKRKEVEHKQS